MNVESNRRKFIQNTQTFWPKNEIRIELHEIITNIESHANMKMKSVIR